jgi:hypothetical protein
MATSGLIGSASSGFCLTCRTALAPGEPCDGGRQHRVADLATVYGQTALLAETWGPAPRRRRLQEIARAGRQGSGVGGALDLLNCGCDGLSDVHGLAIAVLVIAVAASLFMLVAALVGRIRDARVRRRVLRPYGAFDLPVIPRRRGQRSGIVVGVGQPSPLRGEPCVAYRVGLHASSAVGRGTLLWQEAATTGFDVLLDDGEVIRVRPGRVRMAIDRGRARAADKTAAANRLPLDTGVEVAGELPLVPFDEAEEEVIRSGDRVIVLGKLERRQDSTAAASNRAVAPTILVPVGVPALARA